MRHPSSQRFVAALLMLTLALAGAGRGALAASMAATEPALVVNGIVIPICHPGQAGDGTPDQATHHDCCDACALCAPVLLPTPPVPAPLSRTVVRLDLPLPATPAPVVARLATPRSSQGPPAAPLALPFEPSPFSALTA